MSKGAFHASCFVQRRNTPSISHTHPHRVLPSISPLPSSYHSAKRMGEDTNKTLHALADRAQADANSIRQQNQAYANQNMGEMEKRKEENAKTHNELKDLKEQGQSNAKEVQEVRLLLEEEKQRNEDERRENAKRYATLVEIAQSAQKAPNPNPSDGNSADIKPSTLFGDVFDTDDDGKVTGVATKPASAAVSTGGPKDDEDLQAYIARLKLEKEDLERENEDLKDKQRALTVPKGSVGLSEVHPSALNQSGRAKKAEAKHVEAKTKRRQQDEQDKAMMKQRYVPKPTPRLTRSRAAAKK